MSARLRRHAAPALLCLAMLGCAVSAFARSLDKQAAEARAAETPALTVFIDARFGARTAGAAEQLTASHRAFGRQGYLLVDVEAYSENGDLVGFFVSYRLSQAGDPR